LEPQCASMHSHPINKAGISKAHPGAAMPLL